MAILVTTDPMYGLMQTTSSTMLTGMPADEIVNLNRAHGSAIRLVASEGES